MWEDFTTYFNLYYNTSNMFHQAEESILSQRKDLFQTGEYPVSGSTTQLFIRVVEKCSKILQFHAESDYVDDALLMLGKSFYYQKNYLKALRKFQELLATQPKSSLILETKLWIGKTQMSLNQNDDGLALLRSVIDEAAKEGEDDIVKDAYVEIIKYDLRNENYTGAITEAKSFLAASDNSDINAEIVFELGKLYNKINDPENAVLSFKQVFDYSPSYETEFNAKLELGKALRATGKNEEALKIFKNLRSEEKYKDNYAEIELEEALTSINLKHYEEGLKQLTAIDTAYSSTVSAGTARYEIGKLYELVYKNLDSAQVYYQKTAGSAAPSDILFDANEKLDRLKKYQYLTQLITEGKKQLNYAEHPEEFVKDSIAFYADTVDTKKDNEKLKNLDEKELEFNRENARGIRDELRIPVDAKTETHKVEKQPPVKPTLPIDTLKNNLAKDQFELGNLFFTELNLPDSAFYYYNIVLTKYPDSKYKAKTMYAMGSYYLTINDTVKADSLFLLIYDNFKTESVVNAAAEKLGKPYIDLHFDPAKGLYSKAESKMLNKNYDSSLVQLYNIYKEYPKSPFASKALYTSGWILENKLDMLDSAASIYDTLSIKYPSTEYTSKIMSKLSFYKSEKKRIRDSVMAAEKRKLDSLAVRDSLKIKKKDSLSVSPKKDLIEKVNRPAKLDSLNIESDKPDSLKVFRKEEYIGKGDSLKVKEKPDKLENEKADTLNRNRENLLPNRVRKK